MSQAQKNQESSGHGRTRPPALAPRHSHIAPRATHARSTPPPPPLAALRRLPTPLESLPAPRLSVPAPAHLAIVPLWDDANLPLRPAEEPTATFYWLSTTTVSVAVGALVAASLVTLRFGDYAEMMPHGQSEPAARAPSAQVQLMAAATVPMAVQAFESDDLLEIDLSEIEEIAAAPQPVSIPELKVTSRKIAKAAKASKRVKVKPPYRAPKQRKRGKRGRTMPAAISAAQPAPQAQPEISATQAAATPPAEAAVLEVVPAPAPALPANLTRAEVKRGLDGVRAKVLACTNGTYGKILADVTISAPGQVSNAAIEGTFAGTKAAECMTQKISNAKFPAFSGPDISVHYPYSF